MDAFYFIDKKNYFARINYNYQNKINKKIANLTKVGIKLKTSRNTISRISKQKNYWCNISILFGLIKLLEMEEKELIDNIVKIKTKNSFPIKLFNIELDESLARMLGHLLGDGGIHIRERGNKYRAFYVNNEDILLKSFESDARNKFGNDVVYSRRRENRGDEIWLASTVGCIFYKILENKIADKKEVPDIIKRCNNENIISSFLQALYDDEGFIYPNKYMIVISLKNRILLNQIRDLVKKIGIEPNNILIHTSKNRTKMYYFSITNKKNFNIFKSKIDFLHPKKKEKLNILIHNYKG